VENTNSTILEVQGSFGLSYMVEIIPPSLRSQEMDKGVPRARALPPSSAGPGSGSGSGSGVARQAGRQASGRGVVVLIFSTH
jgi:hypothetical protein